MNGQFEPGAILLEKYKIEEIIGKGGFGSVYRAIDLKLKRTVALKTLLHGEETIDDRYGSGTFQEYVKRFEREAEVSSFFTRNPHIITVYALEQDKNDNYFLALEYLEGGSLSDHLKKQAGPLPPGTVYSIAMDICLALKDIHNHPADIVHRDLKPANILLHDNGQAVVADFGVAQVGRESHRTEIANARHPGSPPYKSPEQESSYVYLTPASDLYSLGLIIYEMATGKLYKKVRVLPASRLNSAISPALDAIIEKALKPEIEQRYQQAEELYNHLEKARQRAITPSEILDGVYNTEIPTEQLPSSTEFIPALHSSNYNAAANTRQAIPPAYSSSETQNTQTAANSSYSSKPRQSATSLLIPILAGILTLALLAVGIVLFVNATASPAGFPTGASSNLAATVTAKARTAGQGASPTSTTTSFTSTPQQILGTTTLSTTPDVTGGPTATAVNSTPEPTNIPAATTSATATGPDLRPTNTPRPESTATPVPFTNTPEIKVSQPVVTTVQTTATPTPTPRPTATATPTPSPTATPTRPSQGCSVVLRRGFGKLYDAQPDIARKIGCPTVEEVQADIAFQPFERGFMLWYRATPLENNLMYAFYNTGRWESFADPGPGESGPKATPTQIPVTSCRTTPVSGFGIIWARNLTVRNGLGCPTSPELGTDKAAYQPFSNGRMYFNPLPEKRIYVVFADNTFLDVKDTFEE